MIAARQIFLGRGGAKLPYDAEVEYLKFTGTQWIDTLLYGNLNTSYDMVFTAQKGCVIFGNRESGTSRNVATLWGTDGTFTTDFGSYNTRGQTTNAVEGEILEVFNSSSSRYLKSISRNITLFNVTTSYATQFTTPNTLAIGYKYPQFPSSTPYNLIGNVYSCRIWDNGVLTRDFIPVRVGGVGYMYDRVSGQLFRNQGTGAFGYGNDK